jgi:PAS domain S-box-containing protein
MNTRPALTTRRRTKAAWFVLIVALAMMAGMFAAWRAPGLNLYAQDRLMRARGELSEPDDIVIVAIDEPSITRLGQFPWRRGLTAQVLDKISVAQPKAIALDVLYSEPTDEAEDNTLTDSIKKAGNVVVSEQLIEDRNTPELSHSEWLRSLPEIERAAAGTGHVNVATERDGEAREMILRLADDEGNSRWALALETVRVGDALNKNEINETSNFVRVGTRKIPFDAAERNLFIKNDDANNRLSVVQPLRMTIDYIGATGSFAAQTVSFADILEGNISPEKFRGKYVLIGATAATFGDRIATPFVHTENAEGDQHGDLMPGVEILANSVNTILRGRFYRPVSDWTAAFLAALAAISVLFLMGIAEGRFEAAKQIGVLGGLFALIILGSYFAFTRGLIIPPVVPMIASFAVAAPLALLRRSLAASAGLDERIAELLVAGERLFTNGRGRKIVPGSVSDNDYSETTEKFAPPGNPSADNFFLPRGIEWKTQALGFLARDLIERALFIDSSLRSISDGLLITDAEGQIAFANESARRIFNLPERRLLGRDVFDLLAETENKPAESLEKRDETFLRLLVDRESIEREIVVGKANSHYYHLRMTAVKAEETDEKTLGIIVTLSDITQHRELQQTKNDVIALVTHELRTPLTAIQGMSELLTEHEIEPEAQTKMLSTINSEAKRLARMVNEYLDITRLESGAQKAHFASVDAEAVVEQTLLLLEPLAAARGIKIVRRYEAIQPSVSADAELLARAVTNIIANAVKYSPDKTAITIETSSDDRELKIIVRDEGCGISAEQLPRIFEKFYRASRRQTKDVAGTGLGLALTQEIVELHGGRVVVESEPDKGSTFTIFLPFAAEK